jgi:hypothetical protein
VTDFDVAHGFSSIEMVQHTLHLVLIDCLIFKQ